jgi:hypothetical protein
VRRSHMLQHKSARDVLKHRWWAGVSTAMTAPYSSALVASTTKPLIRYGRDVQLRAVLVEMAAVGDCDVCATWATDELYRSA